MKSSRTGFLKSGLFVQKNTGLIRNPAERLFDYEARITSTIVVIKNRTATVVVI